nr:mitogen-activated protein kinase kinase kinase ANP1-like [Ipomoea batatas]
MARSSSSSTDPPVFAVKSSKLESSRSLRVEGRILNQLRGYPYIVHCFGDGTSLEHEEVVYNLLLEYAPGGSRESLIKSRVENIMEFEVSFYAYKLLTGIQEVRDWGFIHCDLKPGNVLVFPCGCGVNHLKIADFGLAKPSGVNIFGGCHRGSLLYTSPESLVFEMHEAPKDIWAIGCIVVEMITGNPARRFNDSKDASLNIVFKKPEIPEGISNRCKDFLERCFESNPSTRWTAVMLLNHPFVANDFNLLLGKKLEDHHQVNSPFGFEGWSSTTSWPAKTAGSYGTVFLGRLSSSSSTDPPVFAVKSSKLESSRSLRVEGRFSSSSSTDLPVFEVKYSKLESSRSFRVEGRILNQLRGCPYIVHCFGDGTSLEHEELLTGIQEVRGWVFVHCDLKPGNVLVFPCGCGVNRLKIADFGLVMPSGVNIFGGCHRGSLLYTSPESLVFEMHEAPKDIWAIGCIVVEMITGNPTRRFNDSKDASLNIVFKKPEIPEGISNRCKDFLERCFESNPSTRWTAVMLLNHPFVANEFNLLLGKKLEDHHQVNSPFGFEGWSSTTSWPAKTAGSYGTVFLGQLSSSSSTEPPVFAVKSSKLEFSRSLRVEGRLSSSSSTDLSVFAVKYSKLESSRSFRVEGRILNKLRGCPYIVHCFGDGTSLEHEEVVYNLLLEYAPGGSRESLIKSRAGNIMEFEVSFYAYQLLTGIQEVHGWGFVHCDLKPANVLVFPCGCGVNRLKIADFGLAKPSGVNIFGGFHRGSLLYTSLESLVSEMHEAPKDIWAIGCIVVVMITGNPAWRFNDSKDASLNIVFKKPEIPEGISNRCKDFLEWCFESNPSTRLTAVMLLNHPFVANEFNLLLGKKLEDHHQVNSPFGFEGWSSTTCLF